MLWQKLVWLFNKYGPDEEAGRPGDFTATPRVITLSVMAIVIGCISGFVALVLTRLIGFFTNLFFFQRFNTALTSPAQNKLGLLVILIPIIGGVIVGLMARYGSDKIRGHGIPEAIESIMINGSKIPPKVAILKPISAAIAIGSGGPFGAEGPIIMTGGAIGSVIAQTLHLTSSERKILLVAGAAGGMTAIFNTPLAAILLAIEVLLFEWKPRSLIPVALASGMAALTRYYLLGGGPLFPVPPHAAFVGPIGLLSSSLVGVIAGFAAACLTAIMYACEDAFHKLPIHWMWWPAIGGIAVGIGGFFFPQALGVGYDVIDRLLQGNVPLYVILGVLVVKTLIWSISLGSGTSGGVVAPTLMIGCALGALLALFLPNEGLGFWSLICMAAMLGATMRAPFMSIVFSMELTHDFNAALPLLIAVMLAHMVVILIMRRSILTEKISRRGFHISQEYALDPLEILQVQEVMRTNIIALPASTTMEELPELVTSEKRPRGQYLFPIVDDNKRMIGVITYRDLHLLMQNISPANLEAEATSAMLASGIAPVTLTSETTPTTLASVQKSQPVVAYPDEPLRRVVNRMAATGYTRMPVVKREDPQSLVGIVSLNDLLKARTRLVTEERQRERVLQMEVFLPRAKSRV